MNVLKIQLDASVFKSSQIRPSSLFPDLETIYTLHVISRNGYHQGQVLDICTLVNHVHCNSQIFNVCQPPIRSRQERLLFWQYMCTEKQIIYLHAAIVSVNLLALTPRSGHFEHPSHLSLRKITLYHRTVVFWQIVNKKDEQQQTKLNIAWFQNGILILHDLVKTF